MVHRWWRFAALTVLTIALLESTAYADRVSGVISRTFVIVEDTELVGDVTCTVENGPCFSFGAANVQLRLNGFTITGRGDPTTGCGGGTTANEYGITTNAQNDVVVQGPGLVQRFRNHGVFVTGSTNGRVEGVTASTNCGSGILIAATSFSTLVQGNLAVRNGAAAGACGGI